MPKKPRKPRPPKPQPQELPNLTGIGVEPCKDDQLLELASRFIDETENKTEAAKELKKIDADIVNRMAILGLEVFRAGDNIWTLDVKKHVKKSKVKTADVENQAPANPEENEP